MYKNYLYIYIFILYLYINSGLKNNKIQKLKNKV